MRAHGYSVELIRSAIIDSVPRENRKEKSKKEEEEKEGGGGEEEE